MTTGDIAAKAGFPDEGANINRAMADTYAANAGVLNPLGKALQIVIAVPGGQALGIPAGGLRATASMTGPATVAAAGKVGDIVGKTRASSYDWLLSSRLAART